MTQVANHVAFILLSSCTLQWHSEVTHFCAGLPVLLVGCKKDLRRDPKTIDELRKTSQRPVTPEEVRLARPNISSTSVLVLISIILGHGRGSKDQCKTLSRMLGPNWRRRTRSVPIRHPRSAPPKKQEVQKQQMYNPLNVLLWQYQTLRLILYTYK